MEEILKTINKHFISLPDDEVTRNNEILGEVLDKVTEVMKKNPLFKELYRERYYGGSYYDGLKVGKPEEYDLDILFALPKCAAPRLINSDIPGFGFVHLDAVDILDKQAREAVKYQGLKKMLDEDCYLVTAKVSSWMEGVMKKALDEFPDGKAITTRNGTFYVTTHKAGPAFTLKLKGSVAGKPLKMDIDLVPCFVFGENDWPKQPYRQNPVRGRPEFFVVPKKPNKDGDVSRHWRLSFQKQESVLLNDLGRLKPALRLLKKLRDRQDHVCIASYYIKTIFLWEVEKDRSLWHGSLTDVFMQMLKNYQQYLERGTIPFYWNDENNLIERPSRDTMRNLANRLNVIIAKIEKNPEDVAKFLLGDDELERFRAERNIVSGMERLRFEPEAVINYAAAEKQSKDSSWCSVM